MSITYVQAAEPIWYIVGLDGLAAGGAQIFTKDSETDMPRDTYQDAAGLIPNTNPIIAKLNGTIDPPIFWQVDTAKPMGYYIEVYDKNGNPLWAVNNFPLATGGGGSNVTTILPLQNYITNNQFINHIADQPAPTSNANIVIAPANHKGFTPAQPPLIGTFGALGPDTRFIVNAAGSPATDQITFPLFLLSDAALSFDNTPVDYIRYQCTGAATGESYKDFQFPITQKVKNLSGQKMTFSVWAKVTSTPVDIKIYTRQYYGSGTNATPEQIAVTKVLHGTYSLTTSWVHYRTPFFIPTVGAHSIGTIGSQTDDDALYINLEMPLDAQCDVQFTKPCLFMGDIVPTVEFDSYDQIDSIDSTARTGDIKTSLLPTAPLGWIPMNDSYIGNTSSGATFAGAHLFQLYATIYTSVIDAWAPVTGARTGGGNTMADAITDFLANKKMQLPLSLGRSLAGAGAGAGLTPRALGQYLGEETHTLTPSEIPVITPTAPATSIPFNIIGGTGNTIHTVPYGGSSPKMYGVFQNATSIPVTINPIGGGAAHNNMQPTSFFNVFIKL